jgi:hypothetical protein
MIPEQLVPFHTCLKELREELDAFALDLGWLQAGAGRTPKCRVLN